MNDLISKNDDLNAKLNKALTEQKQMPAIQTKVVEAPPKIVEVVSKEA